MKTLLAITLFSLLASCATPSLIQIEDGIIISGVQKSNDHYIVEAYGVDQKGDKKFVYWETATLPGNLYDTLYISPNK